MAKIDLTLINRRLFVIERFQAGPQLVFEACDDDIFGPIEKLCHLCDDTGILGNGDLVPAWAFAKAKVIVLCRKGLASRQLRR